MEVTIANYRDNFVCVVEPRKARANFKKNVKFSTSSNREALIIARAKPVQTKGGPNSKEKRSAPFKDMIRKFPTLKELQEKKIP